MELTNDKINLKVKKAVLAALGKKVELNDADSFVAKLGFNSLRMVSLSLALEDEFNRPLLLNDWISRCDDPQLLTISSLCEYIHDVLSRNT